jgi:hypothetical protein
MHRPYGSEVVDHRGLVAGMWDARGMGAVLDRTMPHTPATRMVTVGGAVQALVRHGLGLVHPPRALVPLFFQPTPTQCLIAPGIDAQHRPEDTRGRAGDRLYASGITARYRLSATTAAPRLGLALTLASLDRPRCHVDGRDKSAEEPEPRVRHLTRGSSRAHR